tara:strand:- start:3488 stop:3757 length:270 start_codon:yes stop_codon:yes gene_type:complete
MKEKNNKESIPEKFWKEYEESNLLEREEKLKPIIEKISKIIKIKDEKMRHQVLQIALISYFDDLLEYKNNQEMKEFLRKIKIDKTSQTH